MAVAPTPTETTYALTAANLGPFDTVFPYLDHSDVAVKLDIGAGPTTLYEGADYTQADAADPLTAGGTVTLSASLLVAGAWPAGARVSLVRATPKGQPSSVGEADGFSPTVWAAAIDNVERQVQELASAAPRMLQMPYGDTGLIAGLSQRASRVLGFDATGALYYAPLVDPATIALGPWDANDVQFHNGLTGGVNRSSNAKMGDRQAVGDFATPAQADTSGKNLIVPEGVTVTTRANAAALLQNYWGPGQIETADNNKRGRFFSHIAAAPSSLANHNSIETAFSGDISHSIFQIEHRITGAATLSKPTTGYVYTEEAYPIYAYLRNESGWNQGTANNVGRTGCNLFAGKVEQWGQGDCTVYNGRVVVGSTRAGSTHFLANPAGVLFNGDMFASADGVYLNARELIMMDNGYDVAAIGDVVNMVRTNDTGAKSCFWGSWRTQNSGTKPADSILSALGPFHVGIDFAVGGSGLFPTNQAAISLAADQRIYFNNFAPAAGNLQGGWRTTQFTDWYISYNNAQQGIEIIANGGSALRCTADHVAVNDFRFYANDSLTIAGACPTTTAGQIAFGGNTSATASNGGIAPPGAVAGYIVVSIAGTFYKVPYYPT